MKTLFYYVVLSYSKFTDVPKQKADAEISKKNQYKLFEKQIYFKSQ